jgi:hypothetical protein
MNPAAALSIAFVVVRIVIHIAHDAVKRKDRNLWEMICEGAGHDPPFFRRRPIEARRFPPTLPRIARCRFFCQLIDIM